MSGRKVVRLADRAKQRELEQHRREVARDHIRTACKRVRWTVEDGVDTGLSLAALMALSVLEKEVGSE
jgi:hypothetical protein